MSWFSKLEPKLQRFAIPGLVRILAAFQGLSFVLINFVNPDFLDFLYLNPFLVLQGEVWRLFTWVFVPPTNSLLFIFFAIMFLLMVGDGLEQAWGSLRLNLYIFGGAFLIVASSFLSLALGAPGVSLLLSGLLFSSLILAFAINYPEHEILLMLIIPLKMKWLGLITGALILFWFIREPPVRIPILLSLGNFFFYAVPLAARSLKHRTKVAARREKFQQASLPGGEAFHYCVTCKITEKDDPDAEFRVGSDGEEYCSRCNFGKETSGAPTESP